MAFPTILVDSATGSDTAASGAGPATALTGTAATSSADGLTVTLDGSPDLSGVATDGSAALFLAESVAGRRCFTKITAVDNGAKTVTVSPAVRASIPGGDSIDWAIGGKRASVYGSQSKKLWDNNGAAGDAAPGWIIEMQSGHTETLSERLIARRAGDTTSGPVRLRGAAGGTRPVLTSSVNDVAILVAANFLSLKFFELRNSNATKTASIGISHVSAQSMCIEDVKISHATDKFWKGIVSPANTTILKCEIGNCDSHGITSSDDCLAVSNYVHNCGGNGFDVGGHIGVEIVGNIIYNNTGDGVNWTPSGGNLRGCNIIGNTIDDNGSDGVEVDAANAELQGTLIINNILSNNAGYGLNFSNASLTAEYLDASCVLVKNNNTFNNTSGAYKPSGYGSDDPALDPQYTNVAGGDWSIGTNLKAQGFSETNVGTGSSTRSYVDIGAAQRQEPAGGGGIIAHRGMVGGMTG